MWESGCIGNRKCSGEMVKRVGNKIPKVLESREYKKNIFCNIVYNMLSCLVQLSLSFPWYRYEVPSWYFTVC